MLARPANITAQQASHYYEQDDYYDRNSDADAETQFTAYWFGKGAKALRVEGAIDAADFKSLLEGRSPQGRRLHAKPIQPEIHRAGTDYTFNAPKSVSIAALVQQDERLVSAHDQSVQLALTVMEARYVQARVWNRQEKRQVKVSTGNLAIGVYRHETSRNQDPHLHSHCVAINATQVEGEQWRAVSNELAVHNQKLLGQIYQNELAYRAQKLGYAIERHVQGQFDLKGYDAALLKRFSSRRQEMEKFVADSGEPESSRLLQRAALQTRQKKTVLPREQVVEIWHEQVVEFPPVPGAIEGGSKDKSRAEDLVARAVEDLARQQATFSQEQLERHLLEQHLGECTFDQLQESINLCPRLTRFEDEWTTPEQVEDLRSLSVLLGGTEYAQNETRETESARGNFDPNAGTGDSDDPEDALRTSRALGAVTDRLNHSLANLDRPDWAAEFSVSAIAQGVRAVRERRGLTAVADTLHRVGTLCLQLERATTVAGSVPPQQAAPEPPEVQADQAALAQHLGTLIREIWQREQAGRPKLKASTFEQYAIQVEGEEEQPQLFRQGELILEATADGYQGHGLTEADGEAVERHERLSLQQAHERELQRQAHEREQEREAKRQKQAEDLETRQAESPTSAPTTPSPVATDFDPHTAARSMLQYFRQRLKKTQKGKTITTPDGYCAAIDPSRSITITRQLPDGTQKVMAQDEKTSEGWKVAIAQVTPEDWQTFTRYQAAREEKAKQPKQKQRVKSKDHGIGD